MNIFTDLVGTIVAFWRVAGEILDLIRASRYAPPLGQFGIRYTRADGCEVIIGQLDHDQLKLEEARIKLARRTNQPSGFNFLGRTKVVYVEGLWDLNMPRDEERKLNHYFSGNSLWLNVLGTVRTNSVAA